MTNKHSNLELGQQVAIIVKDKTFGRISTIHLGYIDSINQNILGTTYDISIDHIADNWQRMAKSDIHSLSELKQELDKTLFNNIK